MVCHLACSPNLGAQVKAKIGLTSQQARQSEDRRQVNVGELDGVWIQLQFKDAADAMPQETVANLEVLQRLKETLLHPQRKRDGVTPHTLHLSQRVQQNNPEGSMRRETTSQ